jgi:hypothetical protein
MVKGERGKVKNGFDFKKLTYPPQRDGTPPFSPARMVVGLA